MMLSNPSPDRRTHAVVEGLIVTITACVVIAALAYQRGYMGWSWDALNHHIYLGMIAESSRWHLDVAAAASQTYQYPYLYWPTYRLSLMSGSGAHAVAMWAAVQTALVVPPLWLLVYRTLPDEDGVWEARLYRFTACALALMSLPVLAALGTTANDLLAAVPVLWALAGGIGFPGRPSAAVLASTLLGVAVAFKYSNALFVPVLMIIWWQPKTPRLPIRLGLLMAVAAAAGFALAYGPWGWQLWRETGNPFYPNFSAFFVG